MLSYWQILGYMVVIFLFFFPFGYLVMHWKQNKIFGSFNFFVRLPVYISLGMAVFCLIFFILGHLIINIFLVLGILLVCLVLLVIRHWRSFSQIKNQVKAVTNFRSFLNLDYLLPPVLFLISLFIFARFVDYTHGLPIWGDPMEHSLFTSSFIHHGRIVHTISPIAAGSSFSDISYYPLGFHTMGAGISLLTGLFPGEALFLLGASVATLVPCILFSLVYTKTKSPSFSLIPFLLIFIAPFNDPFALRSYALFAGFLQGAYPSLLGILFCLSFCYLAISLTTPYEVGSRTWYLIRLLIVALALFISYTTFFPFTLLYIAAVILYFIKDRIKAFMTSRYILIIGAILIVATVIAGTLFFTEVLRSRLLEWTWLDYTPEQLERYYVPASFLISNANGLIILIASLSLIGLLVWRKHFSINLFYLFFLIPFLLASNWYLYTNLLWFTTPMRSVWVLIALSYVLIPIAIHHAFERWHLPLRWHNVYKRFSAIPITLVVLTFISLAFLPPFNSIGFGILNYKPFCGANPTEDEYHAMAWIAENIPSDELILNDRSWTGDYIPMFGLKNQVYFPYRTWPEDMLQRMDECGEIFEDPANYTLLHNLIEKWQIKYVFVTANNYYPDFGQPEYGVNVRWWDAPEILILFGANPDLEEEFRTDRVGVFRTYLTSSPERKESTESLNACESTDGWSANSGIDITVSPDSYQGESSLSFSGVTGEDGNFAVTLQPSQTWDLSGTYFLEFWVKVLEGSNIEVLKAEIGSSPEDYLQYIVPVPSSDEWMECRIAVDLPLRTVPSSDRSYSPDRYSSYTYQGSVDLSAVTYFKLILTGDTTENYTIKIDTLEAGIYEPYLW